MVGVILQLAYCQMMCSRGVPFECFDVCRLDYRHFLVDDVIFALILVLKTLKEEKQTENLRTIIVAKK